jgi:hypothetical protein
MVVTDIPFDRDRRAGKLNQVFVPLQRRKFMNLNRKVSRGEPRPPITMRQI